MQVCLYIMSLCLVSTSFSDFEGSGDENSFSLAAEEFMPYAGNPRRENPKRTKKHKDGKQRKTTNSTKDFSRHRNPCKVANCGQICSARGGRSHCSCYKGYQLHTDLKDCIDADECASDNGHCEQICINTPGSFHCACWQNYRPKKENPKTCEAICDPPCLNGGLCTAPNQCLCPAGYMEPNCNPICNPPCENGGTCKRQNICKCTPGFSGPTCLIALCQPNCLNGGHCVYPNVCQCSEYYYGRRCEKVRCIPPCENGGTCLGVNRCLCQHGFTGARCQKVNLANTNSYHKNNSVENRCVQTCGRNNSSRVSVKKCLCSPSATDKKCKQKSCRLVTFRVQVTKMVRTHVTKNFYGYCGERQRLCFRSRLVPKIVPRTVYQLGYKIQCFPPSSSGKKTSLDRGNSIPKSKEWTL